MEKTFTNASSDAAPRQPAAFATNGWSSDDIALLENTARGKRLMARMTGSNGVTVECFSEMGSLAKMIARCKGEANFNKAVYHAASRLAKDTRIGGLMLNCFQIGFDLRGALGAICFTCDGFRKALTLGTGSGNPLDNFITHCTKAAKHETARNKIIAQIDALHADPRTELSRCAPRAPPPP